MISIDQAIELIALNSHALPIETRLLEHVAHSILAENVQSDVDSPPYSKSMMDGYAVQAQDFTDGLRQFEIIERIFAGSNPSHEIKSGMASQIMTGAPIPEGCDAVVMVEQSSEEQVHGKEIVTFDVDHVVSGQNILPRASIFSAGDSILNTGTEVTSKDIGVLAEIGAADCRVFSKPQISVVATGDELVSHDEHPGSGKIRNSNSPMLTALAKQQHCDAEDLGIAADQHLELKDRISWGLNSNILLLSGGVSAGDADLVPDVLEQINVEKIFHKVAVKPGKPIWFGVYERKDELDPHRCLVFGLPGNPASTLACFHLFVVPAIKRLRGLSEWKTKRFQAILENTIEVRGNRETYWPAVLKSSVEEPRVTTVDWKGSADIRAIAQANCLACFPTNSHHFEKGTTIDVVML